MEEKEPKSEEFASMKSTGPTFTRYKCCSDEGECTEFHSWTEVGECYERGGRLQKGKPGDE
ncbi:MAG: hypothetical protein HY914_22540 [Desulfomonile tiedjei]|nr:hypothetical protein [Desulfomonile tiedjei]